MVKTKPNCWLVCLCLFGCTYLYLGLTTLRAQLVSEVAAPQATNSELWFGTLDAGSRRFRFLLKLSPVESGWAGTLQSLDEGGASFKLEQLARTESALSFELPSTGAKFHGEWSAAAAQWLGTWSQRGHEFNLSFDRVEKIPPLKFEKLWVGQLDAVVQKLDIAIYELAENQLLLDSISQKSSGFVGQVHREGADVRMVFPSLNAEFSGITAADGRALSGAWRQNSAKLDVVLSQAEQVERPLRRRPQTPQPPFPYEVRDVQFVNSKAAIQLSGTLTLPTVRAPALPAVVLISGSGPQDRDETIVEHRPFAVLADYLTRAGIAVLRYDDRGVGASEGEFAQATSIDFAEDAAAAVAFLRSLPDIDPERIALCGHSEGALIAPMLAAADLRLAGIVLLAGPGVRGKEILISQNRLLQKAAGVAAEELDKQLAIQQTLLDLAMQTPTLTADAFAREAEQKLEPWLAELDPGSRSQLLVGAAGQMLTPWFQFFLRHEPAEVLRRVRCPVLSLAGSRDLQVAPDLNLPAIEQALREGFDPPLRSVEFEGLNHLFQPASTGAVSEYSEIEQTLAPEVLENIAEWLLAQFAR